MRSFVRHAASSFLSLAILAGGTAPSGGSVLCVAASGHVAIEEGKGRWADYQPATSRSLEVNGIKTTPNGCGPCVDLPLGVGATITAVRALPSGSSTPLAPAPVPAASLLFPGPPAIEPIHGLVRTPIPAPALIATTILRN